MYEDFLHTLLDMAETVSMRYWRNPNLQVQIKADNSLVTKADKEVESVVRGLLRKTYPQHSIFGEEFSSEEGTESQYMWVIDPIDGTKPFVNGLDTFSNMICLLKDNIPIVSAIGFPAKGERYIGINNKAYVYTKKDVVKGATACVRELAVSLAPLSACTVSFSDKGMFAAGELKKVENIISRSKGCIGYGDSYNYCCMARGDDIVVVESGLKPYDFFPLIPIVKGAGGNITDWNGRDFIFESRGRVIAGGYAFEEAKTFLQ